MSFSLIIAAVVVWFISGGWGLVYWTTLSGDLTNEDLPLILAGCMVGPITWLVGWATYGEINGTRSMVIFKKRKS